jgi:hypothetical protein
VEVQETLGGRYKLLHELGAGGMAVVWRARDEVLGRPVAVKVLAGRFAGDPQSRARIRDEARAAATLSHPNIAQVYDYGESTEGGAPLPYVVMELINGPTLQQRVANAPLPPRTVFRICGEVAAALAAAHADGLVHRDIKMANIMVTATGAKVVDFGIAAAVGPASPEEMLVGTPAYLAPERLVGGAVQAASDIYALGVLLYRLLAHEPPWTVETTTQMLNAHIYIEPSRLPVLPGVPPEVADLIDRCLRKDPAERPTAGEVSATLGDAAEAALLPVRDEPTHLAVPSPRAVEGGGYDERTSASLHAVRRSRTVPGRIAASATDSPASATARVTPAAAADELGAWAAPEPTGPESGLIAGSGAKSADEPIAFVPGAEIGAVRPALPGEAEGIEPPGFSDGWDAGGRPAPGELGDWESLEPGRPAAGRHEAAGGADDPARWDSGIRTDGPRWPGEATERRRPGEADRVRKKRRNLLLAGGGVAALLAVVLVLWGLADRRSPADRAASGTVGEAPSRVPSSSVRPSPSASGSRSTTAKGGTAGPEQPVLGVTRATASPGPSATPSASPTRRTPQPSGEPSELTPSGPVGTRLSSAGGSVYAVCAQGRGQLTSWEANPGYTVQKVNQGPALAPEIVFEGFASRYRMTITCVGGTPTPLVLPL